MNRLPNDIARCDGWFAKSVWHSEGVKALRFDCRDCLRLTAPRPENVWLMLPEIVDGQCKNRLISDHNGS